MNYIPFNKIISIFYIVAISMISYPFSHVWAMESLEDTRVASNIKVIEESVPNLNNLTSTVTKFSKAHGYSPKNVLIVCDVDGTLTDDPYPNYESSAKPNGKGPKQLKNLIKKGYCVVVSSAWNDFSKTLQTLKELGLSRVLGVKNNNTQTKEDGKYIATHNSIVASVRDTESQSKYYFQKALSPKYVFSQDTLNDIKAILFCDNSKGNIVTFKNDLQECQSTLYPNLKHVYYFFIDENL